jgi:transglutaminase-like putative cysteine protease
MYDYRIKHITRYSYPSPVIDSANQVMLFPITDEQQVVNKHELIITQHPAVEIYTDYFGNKVGIFSVIKPHSELTIQSNIDITTREVKLPTDDAAPETQWNNPSGSNSLTWISCGGKILMPMMK